MASRNVSGNISKLSVNNGGVYLTIGNDVTTWFRASSSATNYTAFASAIFLAAANNYPVTVTTDTGDIFIDTLVVDC
jgi:hypothetical protein